jgi:outer membrane protein assembly factor BamB
VTRGTTICCSALALIAFAKPAAPPSLMPLRPVWTLPLNNHLTAQPAYDDRRGYFPIEGDRLAAYDLESGKLLWIVPSKPVFPPCTDHDLIFIVEAESVIALNAADGKAAWQQPTDGQTIAAPTAAQGLLLLGSKTGALVALRTADGQRSWQHGFVAPLHATPTITEDRVYVPTTDGSVFALAIDSGETIWEHKVGGSPNQVLALPERVYAGSTDNFLYCLLAKSGEIDWRWRTGGDVTAAPIADDGRVYFVSKDNVLRALSQKSGGQAWMKALPFRPTLGLQLAGATLVVAGESPTIKTFNAADGAPGVDIAAGGAGDVASAPPHALRNPASGLPMLAIVSRNLVNGDSVSLSTRSVDPAPAAFAPLPTTITPAPMPSTP